MHVDFDRNSEDDILITIINYMGTIIAILLEHAAFPICYVWSDTSDSLTRAIRNQIESPSFRNINLQCAFNGTDEWIIIILVYKLYEH